MRPEPRQTPVVAILGLGAMGMPMATRLAGRLVVRAFDVDGARISQAEAAGASRATTAGEAVADAEVVVVGVRNQEQLDAALFGPDGAGDMLRPGSVVVLTSTVGTDVAERAAARLAERAVELLDAPVSGGPVRAGTGDLLVMLGGRAEVIDRARPVLDLLASRAYVVGPNPGDGQTMKAVNQLLCGVHTAAAGEALALAARLGLQLDSVIEILGAGAAASFMLADRGPRMAEQLRGDSPQLRSRLDVISKDMGIVHELCRRAGVPAPVAAAAEQTYLLAEARGLAGEDDSVVATLAVRGTGEPGGTGQPSGQER